MRWHLVVEAQTKGDPEAKALLFPAYLFTVVTIYAAAAAAAAIAAASTHL